MKLIAFLISVGLLVGCNYDKPGSFERLVHCDQESRLLMIDQSFSETRIELIIEAAQAWNTVNPSISFNPVIGEAQDSFLECQINVVNEVPQSEQHADALADTRTLTETGSRPGSAVIRIDENASQYLAKDEPANFVPNNFKLIMIHEFGHALGLDHMHVSNHYSIMEPSFSIEMVIGEEEIEALGNIQD